LKGLDKMPNKPKGKRILIMGLNDSGKTTFSQLLQKKLKCPYFNADQVRAQFFDYDFTIRGRNRQARRMKILCDWALKLGHEYAIADFICPTPRTRNLFLADHCVFLDTVNRTPFLDTQRIFTTPTLYIDADFRVILRRNFEEAVENFIWTKLKVEDSRVPISQRGIRKEKE